LTELPMASSRSSSRDSAAISPTAFYTGYIWYRNGLSHPAFLTGEGERLYHLGQPLMRLSRLIGGPTLEGFLLARHRIIDHLLSEAIDSGRVTQVIEIAAGLSPRGWRFTQRYGKALTYIEADLPGMASRKRRLLDEAKLMGPDHRVVDFDALATEGPSSLDAIAQTLDPQQGVAVITEGLLNYLDREAVKGLWQRVASITKDFRQAFTCPTSTFSMTTSISSPLPSVHSLVYSYAARCTCTSVLSNPRRKPCWMPASVAPD
jgi:O-methyltransferase involved in polyketide biosynthesis